MKFVRGFSGAPVRRLSALVLLLPNLACAQDILPGPELNGAWFDTDTPGQGLLIDINPELNTLFGGWFTFKIGLPMDGDAENHRWYTLQGSLQGSANEHTIFLTSAGVFNDPAVTGTRAVGMARLVFTGCNSAVLAFEFTNGGSDTVTLTRLLPVEESLCDRLRNPNWQRFSVTGVNQRHGTRTHQFIPFLNTDNIDAGMYYLAAGVNDGQGPHGEDEVYIVMSGAAQLQAGVQMFPAEPGDIHYVRAGVSHRFINIAEDLEVLVLFSSAATGALDPEALFFNLDALVAGHPPGVNDWNRFLDVASMRLGSYWLPLSRGGDTALTHEVDEFNIVTQGEADFHVGSDTMRVKPGDLVWVKEGNPHWFDNLSADFNVLILFHRKPGVPTP